MSPEGPRARSWSPPSPWTTGTFSSCHLVRASMVTSRGTVRQHCISLSHPLLVCDMMGTAAVPPGTSLCHRPKAVSGSTHDSLTPQTEILGKPVVPKLKRDLVTDNEEPGIPKAKGNTSKADRLTKWGVHRCDEGSGTESSRATARGTAIRGREITLCGLKP